MSFSIKGTRSTAENVCYYWTNLTFEPIITLKLGGTLTHLVNTDI